MPESSASPAGNSSADVYIDAARELSRPSVDPAQEALDADREADRLADGDPDVVLPDDEGPERTRGPAGQQAGADGTRSGDVSAP